MKLSFHVAEYSFHDLRLQRRISPLADNNAQKETAPIHFKAAKRLYNIGVHTYY